MKTKILFLKKIIIRYHFWIIGLLGVLVSSCNTRYRIWVGEKKEQKIFNLPYGEDKKQVMDVFLPSNYHTEIPPVLIIHGGGWKFGNKEHMIMIQKFLHQNDIVTININYRLLQKNRNYQDQLQDIGLAIRKFNEMVPQTKLKPNNYILLGESAGAHLALLYGYRNPTEIRKIISMSGPTDFYSPTFLKHFYSRYASPIFEEVVGEKFDRKNISKKFVEASPIANVTNVPTLLFQGDTDFLVNKNQAFVLDSVLTEKGIDHQLVYMKNSGHTPRFFSKKKRDSLIFPKILDFVKN